MSLGSAIHGGTLISLRRVTLMIGATTRAVGRKMIATMHSVANCIQHAKGPTQVCGTQYNVAHARKWPTPIIQPCIGTVAMPIELPSAQVAVGKSQNLFDNVVIPMKVKLH